jgi:hypothetical protein
MGFIKKDVNFGLLAIVVILAVIITSLGVYYNYNYSSLSEEYHTQLSNLRKVTDDLLFHKSRLNQTTAELKTIDRMNQS